LVEFIYRNLGNLTQISVTQDTHQAMQIFHAMFLVNEQGENPAPYTLISTEDIRQGYWKFNPEISASLGINPQKCQEHLQYYVDELRRSGKYDLTIWPYHAMLGGIGHALVASLEEAVFFHTIARNSQADFEIKGNSPFTEHYSAIGPEVLSGADGKALGRKSDKFLLKVKTYDVIIIAGQAKSHCVAWTIADLITQCQAVDSELVKKIYLLEDCSSPVVLPGVVDFTEQADAAYARFAEAGAHIVRSTDPIESWLGK
jgi:nicotinamidase-related amidase